MRDPTEQVTTLPADEPIAITGMSCRFPKAPNIEAFWKLLEGGKDAITEVPADRFDVGHYYDPDPDAPGRMYVRAGGFVENVFDFDPAFFGIAPREALSMDPQQRLLLELSWEALEDAGQATSALSGSNAGVFIGHSTNDYVRRSFAREIDAYSGTGSATSIAAGRISYVLGLTGPNLPVDTACSSSLVALHLACQSLRSRECEFALAAGVNLILAPEPTIYFCKMRALAPDGRCKAFDALANGYVRGEGCGAIVLKRLSDAQAGGDRIHAVIRGSAINQDGRSTGLTAPNRFAQEALLRRALAAARVSPEEVDYLEAHGTGTPLGDPIEIQAIASVHAGRPDPLFVGSVKTNIGHLEAAAGIAGVIKTVLAMQRSRIPPHLHFHQPSPYIPWHSAPISVPTALIPWPIKGSKPRLAAVSSFGFSGTNAHVVIEEAPPAAPRFAGVERPLHILCLSARDEEALTSLAGAMDERLSAQPATPLTDICYSANSGRTHFSDRLSIVAADETQVRTALQDYVSGAPNPALRRGGGQASTTPKVAFLFTGQGSQYAQMGRELYDSLPLFRRTLDECEALLGSALEPSLLTTLFPDRGGDTPIDETGHCQPALFALEYSLATVWRSWGVEPAFCLGHSIGELVAACVAGAFSLEDGLRLAAVRGRLMQALPRSGMMVSVHGDGELVSSILEGLDSGISIAAINGPASTVISGRRDDTELALKEMSRRGLRCQPLTVSHAFHSALMEPILDELEEAAGRIRYAPPGIGLVSNVTGQIAAGDDLLTAGYWRRHARGPVLFAKGMRALDDRGYTVYVEVGPQPVLSALARTCVPDRGQLWAPSLRRGGGDWRQMLQTLSDLYLRGVPIDWHSFDQGYQRRRVSVPTYPFQRSRYVIEGGEPASTVELAPPALAPAREDPARVENWLYEAEWRKSPCESDDEPTKGRWLVFVDEAGLGRSLARRLESKGSSCVLVEPGEQVSCSDGLGWRVRPGNPDDFKQLIASVEETEPCVGIVHAWSLSIRDPAQTDDDSPLQSATLGTASVLHLIQALADRHPQTPPPLWLVTRGVHRILEEDPATGPVQAPLWGLARSVAIEYPVLRCTRTDLESGESSQAWLARSTASLLSVLGARDGEDQLAFRADQRYVPRLKRTVVAPSQSAAIGGSGTYLITGGLGGLGLLVAGWMIRQGARHLVLVGRSEPTAPAAEKITGFRELGVDVVTLTADVAEAAQVAALFRGVAETMPPLRGIVHAAGVLDDGAILRQDWSRFEKVMRPKINGAWNLHVQSLGLPLDFMLFFSTVGSLLGAPTQSNYCAANAFMDALAHYRRANGWPGLAINWGPWSKVGMAARQQAGVLRTWETLGIDLLPDGDALEVLAKLLGAPVAQVAVIKADWSKLISLFPQGLEPPFLRDLVKGKRRPRPASEEWRAVMRRLDGASEDDAARAVRAFVMRLAADVLGRPDAGAIEPDVGFFDMGMDSMMAVDLTARLRANLGDAHLLPASFVFDHPTVERVTQYLLKVVSSSRSAPAALPEASQQATGQSIAIVGYACRFPGASNEDGFWDLLCSGMDAIRDVPPDRWDIDRCYDPNPRAPGKMYVREGGFLEDIDKFDAQFFGISPREAVKMDPQHRLLLETSWRALENSNQRADRLRGTNTGVFIGISGNDYVRVIGQSADAAEVDAYLATGNALSIAAGRVSHVFGFEGPCLVVDTACSSSLVAVHLACESLRTGKARVALAGGVNIILAPEISISLCKIGALAPDGRCKTFDASANGYVRSEGCGIVVLKRLEDARRDGDRILATILASSINHDGRSGGLTVPNGTSQIALLRETLAASGASAEEVHYVEAHGTGTPLGDPIEMRSLASVYAEGRPAERPLLVGSVKTNIGHLEAAAGVAGLIKVVQSLERGQVPPNLHFRHPTPHIEWQHTRVRIPDRLEPWPSGQRRLAAVSSFGFSGTNAHCIVEGPPAASEVGAAPEVALARPVHLLCLSARTQPALLEHARNVLSRLATCDDDRLADVCFSLNAGRSHFPKRLAVVAPTARSAHAELAALVEGHATSRSARSGDSTSAPKVAFLFTGLGSQYVGMGRQLFETQPTFRRTIEEADAALADVLGGSLRSVLYPPAGKRSTLARYAQPALFVVEYALLRLWESWGLRPSVVAGHSIGECAAACAAGVFSFSDALKLVGARARSIHRLPHEGGMLAVAADEATVRAALLPYGDLLSVAAVNSQRNTVVAGFRKPLTDIAGAFAARGVQVHKLSVSHAFHSPLVSRLADEFMSIAREITYREPRVPIVSGMSGDFAAGTMSDPAYWARQLIEPVRFSDCIRALATTTVDVFLELGPHPTLAVLAQEVMAEAAYHPACLYSLRRGTVDWEPMLGAMGKLYVRGVDFDWKAFDQDFQRRWVDVPKYPFQRQRFWPASSPASLTAALRAAAPAARAPGGEEPLLGRRLRSPELKGAVFENEFSADHPALLSDHKVHSRVVVPGACHLAMVMAAAARLDIGRPIELRDVGFPEGMILAEAETRSVQLIVSPERDGTRLFRIVSSRDDEQSWLVHSTGHLVSEESALPSRPAAGRGNGKRRARASSSIQSVQHRCSDHFADTKVFYRLLAQHGIELGPQFQWIEEIWRRPGEALARLRLPRPADRADAFAMHPGWIDACFQLLTVTLTKLGAELPTYLPISIGRFTVFNGLASTPWIHVTLRPQKEDDPTTFESDIRMLTDAGELVGRIDRFRVRRAPRESLSRFAQRKVTDSLYNLQWVKTGARDPLMLDQLTGSWLLLEGGDGTAAELARLIDGAGGRCIRARPGREFGKGEAGTYEVDPTSVASFRALLDEVATEAPDLRGVVHLWSCSTAAGDSDPEWRAILDQQMHGTRSALNLVKALNQSAVREYPRLWLVTSGVQVIPEQRRSGDITHSPLWGLGRVIALEHPQLRCTRIDLDPTEPSDQRARVLLRELATGDKEDQVAYSRDERYVARLSRYRVSSKHRDEELELPPGVPYRLIRPAQGSLAEISAEVVSQRPPGPGEVEIRVLAAGLNFRDVLNALGLYPGNPGVLGWEAAGVVTAAGAAVSHRVGDEVVALAPGSFAKFVTTDARLAVPKPANLSFAAAAASPVVFLTAHYALHGLAGLSQGDKILIHAAAGGVGLAAVQLAQQCGAEVYATAGSEEKRQHLKDLGVQHVFDSRSLDFGEAIRAATQETGVDVVLNSLAGEYIPTSLSVLAKNGRFIEIGKLGTWTPEQVAKSRPDVGYFIFALDTLVLEDAEGVGATLASMMGRLASGELEPLPHKVFHVHETKAAFRYMAQAKHIGKIVLDHDVDAQGTDAASPAVREDATYLITGGLGGLGLCLAHWLVEQGAKHLVLVGRRGPTAVSSEILAELQIGGARITVLSADVSDEAETRRVVERIDDGLPPLRGVFHLAGVLDDGLLMNQDWERFLKVMRPKVLGTVNLHKATSKAELDFFVMFSSSASLMGFPGQGNYAAANSFLDAFAHYRVARGQPALTINWGAWDEVGMTIGLKRQWRALGIGTIKVDQGMESLGMLLRTRSPQAAVLPIEWSQIARGFPGGAPPPFLSGLSHEFSASLEPTAEWLELSNRVAAAPPAERKDLVVQRLVEMGRAVLGLATAESLDTRTPLNELGFDSLMAVELANTLGRSAGKPFSATLLFDYPTFDALAGYLLVEIFHSPTAAATPPGSRPVTSTRAIGQRAALVP